MITVTRVITIIIITTVNNINKTCIQESATLLLEATLNDLGCNSHCCRDLESGKRTGQFLSGFGHVSACSRFTANTSETTNFNGIKVLGLGEALDLMHAEDGDTTQFPTKESPQSMLVHYSML